ncbi:hypothetical protein MLD52_15465 [Puniceicoccaceae bacterium K14]|nr:hypothetical protein [Puniceicoccaceae bacterium K14]
MKAKTVVSGKLRRAIRANAVFSSVSGIVFIGFAGWLASFTGIISELIIRVVGIGLVGFAAYLFLLTKVKEGIFEPAKVWSVVVGDYLWVLGSLVGLALWHGALTSEGLYLVSAIAYLRWRDCQSPSVFSNKC